MAAFLSVIIFVTLVALLVPALWEVICFCLAVFAQVVVVFMLVCFLIHCIEELYAEANEGQQAYSF